MLDGTARVEVALARGDAKDPDIPVSLKDTGMVNTKGLRGHIEDTHLKNGEY